MLWKKFFKTFVWSLSSTFAKLWKKNFAAREIQYFDFFIASTRAFNLSTRAFSVLTRGFELLTRRFELVTHGFELVTRGFELVTRVLLFYDI